jgi:hypothetical protein
MQKLRRFARYWDLVGNSGNFIATTPLIWNPGGKRSVDSQTSLESQDTDGAVPSKALAPPTSFHRFLRFSEWLHTRTGRSDGIALTRLMELLFEFLTSELRLNARQVAEALWRDYLRGGRHDKPGFLKDFLPAEEKVLPRRKTKTALPKRQARHLA